MNVTATLLLAGAVVAVSVGFTGCQDLKTAREVVAATNRVITAASPDGDQFVPYLDVTKADPRELRNQMSRSGVTRFVAGPITGSSGMCMPMWGFSPTEDLLARRNVRAILAAGGSVTPSIGGPRTQVIDSLAANCPSARHLAAALSRVLEVASTPDQAARLDLSLTDEQLTDEPAIGLLVDGLARLQETRGDRNPVSITVTLPADAHTGFTGPGLGLLGSLLDARVKVDTVVADVVVVGRHKQDDTRIGMGKLATIAALLAHEDLVHVFGAHQVRLDEADAWRLLGLRVSIGENRNILEHHPVLTVANAVEVASFARDLRARGTPLGLLSMWSFNRDRRCPYKGATIDAVSGSQWAYPQSRCNLAGSEFAFLRALSRG